MGDFDLNLVRTFVLLYETGSVSRTAEELHLTQPTVSYSLAKLRRRFADDLFQRVGRGLEPTATAHRLYDPLRRALADIDGAIETTESFDPTHMPARFTLALSDLGEISLLPRLVARARIVAPNASFIVRSLDVSEAQTQLTRGEIDAFVATPPLVGDKITRIPLFRENYVGVAALEHPRVTGTEISAAQIASEQVVTVFGPSGHFNPRTALVEQGMLDNVVVEVTRFATLPYLIEGSDRISIVPENVARQFAQSHPLKVLTLPWDLGRIEIAAYARHPSSRTPAQAWLIDFLVAVLGKGPTELPNSPGVSAAAMSSGLSNLGQAAACCSSSFSL